MHSGETFQLSPLNLLLVLGKLERLKKSLISWDAVETPKPEPPKIACNRITVILALRLIDGGLTVIPISLLRRRQTPISPT